jgi:hypothetical protein
MKDDEWEGAQTQTLFSAGSASVSSLARLLNRFDLRALNAF